MSLSDDETDRVRAIAEAEDRSLAAMVRLLILRAVLDAEAEAARTPLPLPVVRPPGAATERPAVGAPTGITELPEVPGAHVFTPQAQNPLRCEVCGGKSGGHR